MNKNAIKLVGIIALVAVFGFTLTACEPEPDPGPPQPGDNADTPMELDLDLLQDGIFKNLGDMISAESGWWQLLDYIRLEGKYVNLDLSGCTISEKSFSPDATNIAKTTLDPAVTNIETGKDKVVSIILPTAATSIAGGSSFDPTFMGFTNLRSISGEKITKIGDYAFANCKRLKDASFPAVTDIGKSAFRACSDLEDINFPIATTIDLNAFEFCSRLQNASFPLVSAIGFYAFSSCSSLSTLSIPKVTSIGACVFSSSGGTSLSVTMGPAAPKLGYQMFTSIGSSKTVSVKVPAGATGYTPLSGSSANVSGADTTNNWANGFRGGGWDGSTWGTGSKDVLSYINQNINLTIERQ